MKALKQADLNNVVFIDIETVRVNKELEPDSSLYDSWHYKMRYSREAEEKGFEENLFDSFKQKAALYAEFGKIVCITVGKIKNDELVLKSYANADEAALLTEFTDVMNSIIAANPKTQLCGHAIKGFDIPYIMRRCLINGIEVPDLFDVADVKPWLMTALDTLELWKGTGFYSASLINIAVALGLPSPKQDMNGSETSEVFYNEENGLERIKTYCERDVETVCNVVRKLRGEQPVTSTLAKETVTQKVPVITKVYNTKKITNKEKKAIDETVSSLSESEIPVANEILKTVLPK